MFESVLGDITSMFTGNDPFEPVSDYLSGYTSANAANRFAVDNALLQQKLNKENMEIQQGYNEKNMGLQQGYNEKNMSLQQGYNEKNMGLTDSYQRAMMSDSPSIQVAALRRAGLNPLLAVSNGITSAGTAVHAINPSSSSPSLTSPSSSTPAISSPSVNPRLGDALGAINSLSSLGSSVSDILLKNAQTKATEVQSAESAARTLKVMKESDSIDPALEKTVKKQVGNAAQLGATSNAVGKIADIGGSLTSAYQTKKATDLAREAVQKGMTKESAVKFVKDTTGIKPSTSAASVNSLLKDFGLLSIPLGIAVGAGAVTHKAQKEARKAGRISFTNHMSAGW